MGFFEWGDTYVMTETIKTETNKYMKRIKLNTKQVKNESAKIFPLEFHIFENGYISICAKTSNGMKDVGSVDQSPYGRIL